MATIPTANIVDGQIIYSEHVLRIIDALDGSTSNTIIITGDFNQGASNQTNNANSFAHGQLARALGAYSHAEGYDSYAYSNYSHVEGYSNTINVGALAAHAEGKNNTATGPFSHVEGSGSTSLGTGSHASGLNSVSRGNFSLAAGRDADSTSNYTIALGYGALTNTDYQIALGQYNAANSSDFVVIGVGSSNTQRTSSFGTNATRTYISNSLYLPNLSTTGLGHFVAFDTASKQLYFMPTSSILLSNVVTGTGSVNYIAVWDNTTNLVTGSNLYYSSSNNRLGIGVGTSPIANLSVSGSAVIGNNISSIGTYAFAQGDRTLAIGSSSFAANVLTSASGVGSVAFGSSSIAIGDFSAVFNKNTIASGSNQFVVGQWNSKNNLSSGFIVGGGTSDALRADAFRAGQAGVYLPSITSGSSFTTVLTIDQTDSNRIYATSSIDLLNSTINAFDSQVIFKSGSRLTGSNNLVFYYPSSSMHVGSTTYTFTGTQYNLSVGNNNLFQSQHALAGQNLFVGNSNISNGPIGNALLVGSSNQYLGPNDIFSPASNALMVGSANTVTSASNVVVMGYSNAITGPLQQAVIFGAANTMINEGAGNATIIGPFNYISASNTGMAFGQSNYVIGNGVGGSIGIAIGVENTSSGNNASLAIGYRNKATGLSSIALGNATVAAGNYSLVAGRNSQNSGRSSIALGEQATASADFSVALGGHQFNGSAVASAEGAFALGVGVTAGAANQIVVGKHNATSGSGYPFVIGHGSSVSSRVDAFRVRSITSSPNVASIVLPIQSVTAYPGDLGTGVAGEMRPIVFGGVYKLALYTGAAWVTASFG